MDKIRRVIKLELEIQEAINNICKEENYNVFYEEINEALYNILKGNINRITKDTIRDKDIEQYMTDSSCESVLTYCNNCKTMGMNLPKVRLCGNCESVDTVIYYDSNSVTNYFNLNKKVDNETKPN